MNAPLQQLAAISANAKAGTEFAQIVKFICANKGVSNAIVELNASHTRFSPRLGGVIKCASPVIGISRQFLRTTKAAQSASGLSGSVFADYSTIVSGFVSSLQNFSAFDGMLGSCVPVPLMTGTVGAVAVGATAYSAAEMSVKAVSKLSITGQQLNPIKAHAIVVITEELAQAPGANAVALVDRELKYAVAVTTDAQFISVLISGLSANTSTGLTAESVRADIGAMLRQVTINQQSKLFILTTPLVAKNWSMLTDQHGVSAFPNLTPVSGEINEIRILTSDAVATGQAVLCDASGIAAASSDLGFKESRDATLQLNDAPDSPPSASTNLVSLYQNNFIGLMIERFIVAARLRSDAVALCTNSNSWSSGNSPP